MRLAANRDGRPRADHDEVAYAANHDLRAPVVTICQLIDSIQEDYAAELPEEVARRLLQIRDKADWLDRLLKRLTRYWRADDTSEPAATIELTHLVGEIARGLAMPAGAVVHTEQASLAAPPGALRKVVCELIDNALRHAERSDVCVLVSATRVDEGWHLSVSDNGPGIKPGYRDRVWRLFATLKTRAIGAGAGLGLPIARRIVEAHGGRVWIEDAPGGGTRVCVLWPPPAGEHARLAPARRQTDQS